MKPLIIVFILITIPFRSPAAYFPEDTLIESKIIWRITQVITQKCALSDSASTKVYDFLSGYSIQYKKCMRDSSINTSMNCRNIMEEMKKNLRSEFGEQVYLVYVRIVYTIHSVLIRNTKNRPKRSQRRRLNINHQPTPSPAPGSYSSHNET